MKNLLLVALLTVSFSAIAGGNHFHPKKIVSCKAECTEAEVKGISQQALFEFIDQRMLAKSWAEIPLEKIEQKIFSKGPEWVMTFFDKNQPSGKQRVFIFVTMKGWLNGANYTGN